MASYPTAEIALVGYTLLILIWNTVAGLDAVPDDAREAAAAMGYSPRAALVRVDLPLALPYVFAGLRVATATVIGLVTVTALIGLGGLGQQITYGFNIGYYTPIIVGLVLSVVLAAVCDLLLVGVQRLAVPWSRSARRARAVLTWRSGTTSGTSWPAWRLAHHRRPTGRDRRASPSSLWRQAELSVAVVVGALVIGGASAWSSATPVGVGLVAVNAANAARAVPSLALLTLFAIVPWISLKWGGFLAAFLALVVLAIPPILTNTYVGMREVDADVRDAARAMGLTGGQVLRTVELPLAMPFLMAGVRTASIEVVATSTLAAYVSYTDLGTPVISGLNTNNTVEAFAGALLVALLAAVVAVGLGVLQRVLTPASAAAADAEGARRRDAAPGTGRGADSEKT